MTVTPKISLFITTQNDAEHMTRVILSARDLVSEIIVVDNGSADKTVSTAREFGAIIYEGKFETTAAQKNFALSKINSPWALSLDADEALTPALKDEIRQTLATTQLDGFSFMRCTCFLGRPLKRLGRNSKLRLRLIKTKQTRFIETHGRDSAVVDGRTGTLKNYILHFAYNSISIYIAKLNEHTSLEAQERFARGQRFSLLGALLEGPAKFIHGYIFKLGFLDGIRGLIWATYSMLYVFVRHIKLWDLQRTSK